jgi:DNA-binding NarL/FixJ family response regulator
VRVLLVDDSPEIRDLLALVLRRRDVRWEVVGEAENGEEAIAQAERTQPEVVLLDIAMPVMDGMQALPKLLEVAPKAVVVMLSGYGASTAERAAHEAGAHGYIEKDNLVDTLVPQVRAILGRTRPRG